MGIRIELPQHVWSNVLHLADRDYRTPKQQCEFLILRGLGIELPMQEDISNVFSDLTARIAELETLLREIAPLSLPSIEERIMAALKEEE